MGICAVLNAIKVFKCCIQVVSFWLRTISIFLAETFFHLGFRVYWIYVFKVLGNYAFGEFYDVRVLCFMLFEILILS